MAKNTKIRGKQLNGKTVISDETGRKFGTVGDVCFIAETGELMNLVLKEATKAIKDLQLQKNDKGDLLIPFTAVKSIGDFVIVSEKDVF